MRTVVTDGAGGLRVAEADMPVVPAGGARVRVDACGVCGSDVEKVAGTPGLEGRVLGHEVVGRIVGGDRVGRRVALAHHVPCGRCPRCRRGHASLCEQFVTTDLDPGGFAEYLAVSPLHIQNAVFTLPPEVEDVEGTLLEPLSCVLRALDTAGGLMRAFPSPGVVAPRVAAARAGSPDSAEPTDSAESIDSPGDRAVRILVAGCGSVGLLFLSALRAGAAASGGLVSREDGIELHFLEPNPVRAGLARELGATEPDMEVDVAFVTAPAALPETIARTAPGGVIVVFAAREAPAGLDLDTVYRRELTLAGVRSGSPQHLRAALALLAAGTMELSWYRPRVTDMAGLPQGFADYKEGRELKVVVRP